MKRTLSCSIRPRRVRAAICALAIVSLLLLGLLPTTVVAAGSEPFSPQAGPIVRCEPASAVGILGGEDLIVDLYVENVVGLNALDVRISYFDTSVARVVDKGPATGVQIEPLYTFLQPDWVARNTADNTGGTMRYAATQTNPNLPVDGSGPVARVTFHGLQAGYFVMTWGTVELSDVDGRLIPATAQSCFIRFRAEDSEAIVRCDPAFVTGTINGTDVSVDMYIENITDLYGVDLSVSFFDTTIAEVVDKGPAAGTQIEPLSTWLQPGLIVNQVADNTAGTIRYTTAPAAGTPLTGSGPVARITFHGLQAGTFNMTWGLIELSDIDGALIPFTAESCVIAFQVPLSVDLVGFAAAPQDAGIMLTWSTVSELHNAGFNLYRSESEEGPWTRLNPALIPSQAPGSSVGATYSWTDEQIARGVRYFYVLEDVDQYGNATRHDPVSAMLAAPTAVVTSDFSARAGLSPLALSGALAALVGLAAGVLAARSRRGRAIR